MDTAADSKPPVAVKANGTDVDVTQVERVEVRTYTGLPDMATIRMADPEGVEAEKATFTIGDTIEIRFGEATQMTPEPVFRGDFVWAVQRDELEVPQIVRYRIVPVSAADVAQR